MRRLVVPAVMLLAVVLSSGVRAAEATTETPSDPNAKVTQLIKQLGADSYQEREDAYTALEKLGKSAQKALEVGAKDEDLEISSRAKRLLALVTRSETEVALDAFLADKDTKLILKLPTWERFKKTLGDDQKSRMLFVEMHTTEGNLLASLERDPKGFDTAFTNRCQQIQQTLYTPWGQGNPPPMGQVVALLFAATDPRVTTHNINSFYMMTNLLYQQNIQQGFKSSAGARKLLVQFFDQRSDQNTIQQAINIAIQLDLKEMAPTALKAATNKNSQAWTRATALMAVGKLGTKDNIKELEPMLEDKTNLGTMQVNQTRITTEMCDVTLAAMIMLSGQNVMDYDFPYLKVIRVNQQYYGYNYFGFSDNTQREAALKKFKASQPKDEKKEEKK